MAAGGTKQIDVLNAAVKKLAGRLGAKELNPLYEATASLAKDGVCARCLLRLVGHNGMDDYTLPGPSQPEIIAALTPSSSQGTASPSPPEALPGATAAAPAPSAAAAAAGAAAAATPLCPACFGLLPAVFDGRQPSLEASNGASAEVQTPLMEASTAAAAGDASSSGVDLAWIRFQQKVNVGGSAAALAGPVAGHERLPGLPSVASLAAAVRSQLTEGSPNTRALMAASAVAPPPAPAAAAAEASGDVTMTDAAASAAPAGPGASPAVFEALPADVQLGPLLPVKSLYIELAPGPAASALRDVAMHAWVVESLSIEGVPVSGWRLTDIVPLPNVLRRLLPAALSKQLGVPVVGSQQQQQQQGGGCVRVSVVVEDGEEGLRELRALAQHEASAHPGHGRRYHQQHRQNKRQRGPPGKQQQQQQDAEGGQEAGRDGGGGGGGESAKAWEDRQRPAMSWDQAAAIAAQLPPRIVQELVPWPPLPLAKRMGAQQPQQQQCVEAAQSKEEQEQQQQQQEEEEEAQRTANSDAPREEAMVDGVNATATATATTGPGAAATVAAATEAAPVAVAAGAAAAALPSVSLRAVHPALLLAGRYCKLRRHMPQCPWFVATTGERIGGTSVQEAIERFVLPLYGTAVAKMVTGGREDADVRMLGPGRPFVLELQAPVRGHPPAAELRRTEQRMKESKCGVAVQGLKPCGPSALEAIKAAEEAKEKTYRALCWAERPPSEGDLGQLVAMGRVEAEQDTPVRVLHRRAAKVRPKWLVVESATAVPGQPHYFVLQLRTQAGTYVKEFCHGDFGRCHPSLGDLLGKIQGKRLVAAGGAAAATADAAAVKANGSASAAAGDGSVKDAAAAAAVATAAAAAPGGAAVDGSSSGDFVRVEIIQLDVLDVHLENWP